MASRASKAQGSANAQLAEAALPRRLRPPGTAQKLREVAESLAQGSGQVPDALVAYHLRRSCCELGTAGEAECIRLVAMRAAAYAHRVVAAQAAAVASRSESAAPAETEDGGPPPAKVLRVGPLLEELGLPPLAAVAAARDQSS